MFKFKAMDRITLEVYKSLPYDIKFGIIGNRGKFITQREDNGMSIFLYSIESFFIEVWFSPESGRVLMLNGFEIIDTEKLEFYLDTISLADLPL